MVASPLSQSNVGWGRSEYCSNRFSRSFSLVHLCVDSLLSILYSFVVTGLHNFVYGDLKL